MTKIVQFVKNEKKINNHQISKRINEIQNYFNQINQNNIYAIKQNDFNEINQKKNFKSTKCIERYVLHRIIKFAIDQT